MTNAAGKRPVVLINPKLKVYIFCLHFLYIYYLFLLTLLSLVRIYIIMQDLPASSGIMQVSIHTVTP